MVKFKICYFTWTTQSCSGKVTRILRDTSTGKARLYNDPLGYRNYVRRPSMIRIWTRTITAPLCIIKVILCFNVYSEMISVIWFILNTFINWDEWIVFDNKIITSILHWCDYLWQKCRFASNKGPFAIWTPFYSSQVGSYMYELFRKTSRNLCPLSEREDNSI